MPGKNERNNRGRLLMNSYLFAIEATSQNNDVGSKSNYTGNLIVELEQLWIGRTTLLESKEQHATGKRTTSIR